jgi:ABC-type multidrug transport system ATPase subunit
MVRAAIELRAVSQRARPGVMTLRDVTITVEPGELIAIIGASGSGKTTLLNVMSGLCPPASGEITRADGARVGYVPHDDIIHPQLPLARTLRYAAALRHVRDPAGAVEETLRILDLGARSLVPVGSLSGGERKRASIAAALLAGPGLFFLDEPTSGLDPGRGVELMRTLRRLCEDGTTVVLTTHNPLDAEACDKVVVLASGGHLAFFGTPASARAYFGTDSTVEIYERLAGIGDPARNWSRRFFEANFSRTHSPVSPAPGADAVDVSPGDPGTVTGTATLGRRGGGVGLAAPGDRAVAPGDRLAADPTGLPGAAPGRRSGQASAGARSPAGAGSARMVSPVRQWALLTRRNADILTRSKLTTAMLVGSPVVVLLMFLVLFRPDAFSPGHPSPSATVMIMFWVAFGGFFFGLAYGLLAICTERSILRAERFAGLGAGAYVLAKVSVLLPLLAGTDFAFLAVLRLLGRLPGTGNYPAVFVTVALCSAAALGLGLLISAAVSEPSQATILMPVACLPQVLFVGAILPVPVMASVGRWISYVTINRWAFEALGHSLGVAGLWSDGASPLGRPLLASYGTTFSRPIAVDWLVLGCFTLAFLAATVAVVIRKTRC